MPQRIKILPAPSKSTAGFTLLEVLIAFIIAALAISEVLQAVGISLESSRAAAHYQEAVSRARSRLDVAIHGMALAPADAQGGTCASHRRRVQSVNYQEWHEEAPPLSHCTRFQ